MAQMVESLPEVWETWVQSLGWKDPLEKEMATHSSILAWKIPWMVEPGCLRSMGLQSLTLLSDFTFILSLRLITFSVNAHMVGFKSTILLFVFYLCHMFFISLSLFFCLFLD